MKPNSQALFCKAWFRWHSAVIFYLIFFFFSSDLNPKFKAPLENQAIPRGGHARIECHQPDGNPKPQVAWLKNEIAINFETNARLKLLNDGALLISQVRDSDRGSYKCVVTNGIARYVNGPAEITVGDTPVILLDPTTGLLMTHELPLRRRNGINSMLICGVWNQKFKKNHKMNYSNLLQTLLQGQYYTVHNYSWVLIVRL